MPQYSDLPLRDLDEEAALRTILEGTAKETGERFFAALVQNLARALKTHGAWVTEYIEDRRRLRALAFWMDGQWISGYEFDIAGTPCEKVIENADLVHFPDNLIALFPDDPYLEPLNAVSYMGMPLVDIDGRILGHLAVVDRRPMPEEPRASVIFRIFGARAAAELRRLRAESQVREREEKLRRLVDSAMDAIVEFDSDLTITLMNPAAERIFGCPASEVCGRSFGQFIASESRAKLSDMVRDLGAQKGTRRFLWIPGGLRAVRGDGSVFVAEGSLSCSEMQRSVFYTLILRDVEDRLEAERKILSLTAEARYLRAEIKQLYGSGEIVGQSEPLQRVLRDVREVAGTDTTVLILGETGTGKELIARALHAASRRYAKPLIRVNCTALPASLIESEFFGHEKGAFTGATQKRDGRFTLADGGTIFLDEIGDLPLDLQAKLLRVLQEGEFEPVGSSYTRKVDVRIIAATNRNLRQAVREGKFREDLYYRLNVFPIELPPLRERADDIPILASAFIKKFAQPMGREIEPLSEEAVSRLKSYDWPGNVRELQSVIERAVITVRDGRLNLERALPEPPSINTMAFVVKAPEEKQSPVRTVKELEEVERANLIQALNATGWRVSGKDGAARLLGINPSTLSSRMKALGIKRPA
ncbi:MAG: sigma 54-interacting transcriptional regulator [Deltaproteobacteria bacterium]|nr:sigma 54-interacting transcriptional regulator [Deltaproteobacteria bacterium]